MKPSDRLHKRAQELISRAQKYNLELIRVLGQRARERAAGKISKDLLERTRALFLLTLNCKRDLFLLRAEIVQEEIHAAEKTGTHDSFQGLNIPDFLPEEL